jgi:hypothetical protein
VLGDRMRLLVAPGSAEELPGLLEWLEWGTLRLDLTAMGAGGAMEAPWPPGLGARFFLGTDGSMPPCAAGAPLFRETDRSRPRARGGLMPWEAGGGPPDEASALFFREADGSPALERGSLMPRGAGERGWLLSCRTDAGYVRDADGSVSRERGGPLPCEALTSGAAGKGGSLPRQAFAPPVPETDGALPPEPGFSRGRPLPLGRFGSQGAAVWLRPPEPGCEVEASLPTLSALGGGGDAPDLVRLVNTVATECHRVRLRRACVQPPASRAQGR